MSEPMLDLHHIVQLHVPESTHNSPQPYQLAYWEDCFQDPEIMPIGRVDWLHYYLEIQLCI